MRPAGLTEWIRRGHLFDDPGYRRLADALRAVVAVVAAIVVTVPIARAIGPAAGSAPVFAGLVALFSVSVTPPGGTLARRMSGLVVFVPAFCGVMIGVLLPRAPLAVVLGMALVAAASAWLRRFGNRTGALGQLGFVVVYYMLLFQLTASDLTWALSSAGIGVLCGWAIGFFPPPRATRLVAGGVSALTERVAEFLGVAIAILSAPERRRPGLIRRARARLSAIEQATGALTSLLDDGPVRGLSARRQEALRERAFDVQLASARLARAVPDVANPNVTAEERALLMASLTAVHDNAIQRSGSGRPSPRPQAEDRSDDAVRSDDGRRLDAGIRQVDHALTRLSAAIHCDEAELDDQFLVDPVPLDAVPLDAASVGPAPTDLQTSAGSRGHPGRRHLPPGAGARQAAQAGIATSVALLLGSLVSSTHQYWAAMPAFQVLSGSNAETRSAGVARILATLAGTAVGFGLTLAANHDLVVAVPLLIVSVFMMTFTASISKAWRAFWQTIMFATMYDVLGKLSVESVETRLLETAIGAGVAIVVSALVLPTSTRNQVLTGLADLVDRCRTLVIHAVSTEPTAADLQRIHEGSRDLARRLGEVQATAAPLRHQPGSLERDGVHAQLAAAGSLVYHATMAMQALSPGMLADERSEQWRSLCGTVADTFSAAGSILTGSRPASPPTPTDFDPAGSGLSPAMLQISEELVHVNQSLLALVDAVRPSMTHRVIHG